MGFDIKKLQEKKKESQKSARQKEREAKKKAKEEAATRAKLVNGVIETIKGKFEDYIESNEEWKDKIQKSLEECYDRKGTGTNYTVDLCHTYKEENVIDEVIEEYHEEIFIDHYEWKSTNIRIYIPCELDFKLPLDIDFRLKKEDCHRILEECNYILARYLFKNGFRAKAMPINEYYSDYHHKSEAAGVGTYMITEKYEAFILISV